MILDFLYACVLLLISPWLIWRAYRTGRYRKDLASKLWGEVEAVPGTSRPVVWFHGVSVGEIHLLTTLVAAFRQRHPDWHVVVSSTTDTGLMEARQRFKDLQVIAWPLDFTWSVRRVLDRVRPDLIVLAESELWPQFLQEAKRRKIPVAVVNSRLSPRSFRRYRRVAALARRWMFDPVTVIGVQSRDYADRFEKLGVPAAKLVITGSVKYDGAMGERDTPRGRELQRLVGQLRPGLKPLIWVAGSTHAPEESILLNCYRELKQAYPELLLILVPRHPDRFEEVATLVTSSGLTMARRSQATIPVESPAVMLLDTVGELGAAWGLADIGYVGGSLDGRRGGQSMIEPAGYGVPTIFGPHVWNFRDASQRLIESQGAIMVRDASELRPAMERLIRDPELRRKMGNCARQLVREQQGATGRTLDLLDACLEIPQSQKQAA